MQTQTHVRADDAAAGESTAAATTTAIIAVVVAASTAPTYTLSHNLFQFVRAILSLWFC